MHVFCTKENYRRQQIRQTEDIKVDSWYRRGHEAKRKWRMTGRKICQRQKAVKKT